MPPVTDSPPPPYSPTSDNWNLGLNSISPNSECIIIRAKKDACTQVKKYVVEILAFTLGADLAALHTALYPNTERLNDGGPIFSILSTEERDELLNLSTLIQKFHHILVHDGWILTTDRDRKALSSAVVDPIVNLPTCITSDAGFILDLISTYANHQCQPHKRNLTMVARYTPLRSWSSLSVILQGSFWVSINCINALLLGVHDHEDIEPSKYSKREVKKLVRTYADVIETLSPNESVRLVLGRALVKAQADLGLGVLGKDRHTLWWPCESAFRDMSQNLDDWRSRR